MTLKVVRPAEGSWEAQLMRDEKRRAIPNLANALTALRAAPDLAGLLSYDEMQRHNVICRPVPGSDERPESYPRPLDDLDATALQSWLQKHELRRLSIDITHQAINYIARVRSFHPVRSYLNQLRWDGVERLGTWLPTYLGTEASDYEKGIGRMFMIGMVARIMKPGCKADYMLVIEGEQGIGKSAACAILAGDWFSDSMPALTHGDSVRLSMHLRGKWLIEIAEMASISKAEAGALKAFLTQNTERYLPKYGRIPVDEPRQCLFIGTTNQSAYLRDETGGRRFWPAKAGKINLDALCQDRDQLFAEALHAYRAGAAWWPDRDFEAEHIRPEQDDRFVADAWEESIGTYLDGLMKEEVTVQEIAHEALFLKTERLGRAEALRVTGILERLGWVRGKRKETRRPWKRPPEKKPSH
jgi:predicted P-loop ATPase